jgi:hypothetical protein
MWALIARINFYVPGWQQLRKLGANRLIKSAYFWLVFVPIVARILDHAQSPINFALGRSTIALTLALPFSWQVFFLAALATGFANVIYSVVCPAIVRDFETFSDFSSSGRGKAQLVNYIRQTLRRFRGSSNQYDFRTFGDLGVKYTNHGDWRLPEGHLQELHWEKLSRKFRSAELNEKTNELFWALRDIADRANLRWRFLCTLFYGIGTLLATLVLAQNINSVLNHLSLAHFLLATPT